VELGQVLGRKNKREIAQTNKLPKQTGTKERQAVVVKVPSHWTGKGANVCLKKGINVSHIVNKKKKQATEKKKTLEQKTSTANDRSVSVNEVDTERNPMRGNERTGEDTH